MSNNIFDIGDVGFYSALNAAKTGLDVARHNGALARQNKEVADSWRDYAHELEASNKALLDQMKDLVESRDAREMNIAGRGEVIAAFKQRFPDLDYIKPGPDGKSQLTKDWRRGFIEKGKELGYDDPERFITQ